MAVAHDAVSESHTGTSGIASVASFTWNHVPTGTPRSALVFTVAIGANPVTSVTYGGTSMTAVPYTAYDSDTEPGFVQAWFLDNCGTGTKAVVVNRTNNGVVTYATCMTQTAAKACEVYLAGVKTRAAAGAEQTAASSSATGTSTAWASMALDDGSPGTNSIRYMGIYSGAASVSTASTNATTGGASAEIDFGNFVFFTMRETTPSQGSKTLTITTPITDDLAVIGLAIRENPLARIASIVNTGGGVFVPSARKQGLGSVASTGGGIFTLSYARSAKAAIYSAIATGGGVAVITGRHGATRSVTDTGGGVAVITGRHGTAASLASTGGGIAVVSGRKGATRAATATGGGIATLAVLKGTAQSIAITGGGVVTLTGRKGAVRSVAMTGGGAVVLTDKTGRTASVAATGGGTVHIEYVTAGSVTPPEPEPVPEVLTEGRKKRKRPKDYDEEWVYTIEQDDDAVLMYFFI